MLSDPTAKRIEEDKPDLCAEMTPRYHFWHFLLGIEALSPSRSMVGHYKNRQGEGKAAANGFLMIQARRVRDSE